MAEPYIEDEEIITRSTHDGYIQFMSGHGDEVSPDCFDESILAALGRLQSSATAGRGNTLFFNWEGSELVLRHYRRGGLIRHISKKHYWYFGAHRTRAAREFSMLVHLYLKGMPVPKPYACRVKRSGLLYSASLITYRLPGMTLAERLVENGCLSADTEQDEQLWRSIGETIARFHAAGIYHADLNAHNIMLEGDGKVALIDFDRSRHRQIPSSGGWCLANLQRLERSLKKIVERQPAAQLDIESVLQRFAQCRREWANVLSSLRT